MNSDQIKKLERLQNVLSLVDQQYVKPDEFAEVVSTIVKELRSVSKTFDSSSSELKRKIDELINNYLSLSKGVDFTQSYFKKEIDVLKNTISNLKLQHGQDGKDYVLTDNDKKEIADSVVIPDNTIQTAQKVLESIVIPEETGETIIEKINDDKTSSIRKEKIDGWKDWEKGILKSANSHAQNLKYAAHSSEVYHDATLTGKGTQSDPLSATAVSENFKNKVTSADTTPDYLLAKLVAGSNITLTKQNAGANENIKIDAGASVVYPGTGIVKSTGSAWDASISGTSSQFVKADGTLDSNSYQVSLGFTPENISNKATDFSTINNTLYPTVEAVNNQINTAVIGLLDYRGSYDASGNTFPTTGGSGLLGAILKGDFWVCSVAGTLGGKAVTPGDLIIALADTPGQTASNWDLISNTFGFTPENVANKENTTIDTSTTKYPTVNLLKTGLDGKQDKTIYAQIATPANPSSGSDALYFKSDDKLYKKTSAGVESEVGGGGISVSAGAANRVINAEADATLKANQNWFAYMKNAAIVNQTPVASGSINTGGIALFNTTPTAGGTGYTVGDIVTISTGGANAQAKVLTVNGSGTVLTLQTKPIAKGTGYAQGTGQATTGGTGTGLTVNVVSVDYIFYTCPANKRAIVYMQYYALKAPTLRHQVIFANGTTWGTFGSGGVAANTGQSNAFAYRYIFEAGEKYAVGSTLNQWGNVWIMAIEFDDTSPLKTNKITNLASGDNTIYQHSGAGTQFLGVADSSSNGLSNMLRAITNSMEIFMNPEDDVTYGTTTYHIVRGGTASSADNKIFSGVPALSSFPFKPNNGTVVALDNTDSIVINLPGALPNSWAYVTGVTN